jgi:hypothetical protein
MTTKRQEVYVAIDGERAYQAIVCKIEPRTIGDYLVILDTYLRKAKDAYLYEGKGEGNMSQSSLQQVRKIAAVAVSCMEDHGAPTRVIPEEVAETIPW